MSANQFEKKSEAWSALFSEPTSELVQRYTASVTFDKRLWRADIAGSLAHAAMLADKKVIAAADLAAIVRVDGGGAALDVRAVDQQHPRLRVLGQRA